MMRRQDRSIGRVKRTRSGLTLLELMLAMALSGMLLYAVGMAVDLNLRTLEQRRGVIEQSRIARGVMRLISSDLKRVVMEYEQDMSALEAMSEGSAVEALAALGSGFDRDDAEAAVSDAIDAGVDLGSAMGAAGADMGGVDTGDDDSGAMTVGDEETSAYTGDIANATELPPAPGLYGNQFQLQLDIARIPRFDEFFQQQPTNVGELVDVVSDVKTVAYYIQNQSTTAMGGATDVFGDPSVTSGLVRRQLDRAVTQYALANANSTALQQAGEIIAPEVVSLEFRYFDGLEWLLEWDSELEGGLPMAVEIIMRVRPVTELNGELIASADPLDLDENQLMFFRSIVRLPTAEATFMNEGETESDPDLEALGL